MRQRSSQFVFILLLLCSVQLRDEYTLHLAAGAIAGHFGHAAQRQDAPAQQSVVEQTQTRRSATAFVLPPAVPTAWPMARPALDAAAVTSYTSFLRA